jgi:hypothetical protein
MTVREFWHDSGSLARTALAVALLSLGINAATYLGLRARGPFSMLHALHGVVILLGVALFVAIGYAQLRKAWRRWSSAGARPTAEARLPRILVAGTIVAGLYVVALFAYAAIAIGEGGPQLREGRDVWVHAARVVRELQPGERLAMERFELRLFSASWLFFTLVIALAGHGAVARTPAVRSNALSSDPFSARSPED